MVQSGGGYNNIAIYEDNFSLLTRNKTVGDYHVKFPTLNNDLRDVKSF